MTFSTYTDQFRPGDEEYPIGFFIYFPKLHKN